MSTSLETFVSALIESGLYSQAEVDDLLRALPVDRPPQDGRQFADELVRENKLTPYQAEQIAAGQGSSLVLGAYVILDRIAHGGMGVVYRAQHRRMKRVVALKVLAPQVTETPQAHRRFHREVEAAAKLSHPNIVIAFDAGEAQGQHFLVMEYVDGVDLASYVKQHGPLPFGAASRIVLQAAHGLDAAHQHGVVHRDVKPNNLLLTRNGMVKILDMGLALLDSEERTARRLDRRRPDRWHCRLHGARTGAQHAARGPTRGYLRPGSDAVVSAGGAGNVPRRVGCRATARASNGADSTTE